MADDIDELLREVEEKFLPDGKEKSTCETDLAKKVDSLKYNGRSNSDVISHEVEDDLTDLLAERLEAIGLKNKRSPRRSISAKELYSTVERVKCFPVYLSGVIDANDPNQSARPCSNIRCTSCDFRIGQYNHFKWRPGTDYLFLRNHMPEFDRVRVKLAAARGCRAYACQCKFVTVKDVIDLTKMGPDFAKWVCGGH